VASQAQPAPQRQMLLHSQRSPQLQRSAFVLAHPHDVVSHRHWVWFFMGLSWFGCALPCALSPWETQTPP